MALTAVVVAGSLGPGALGGTDRAADVAWRPCGDGFQCGTVSVPLDHADVAGRQIRIALIRKPADKPAQRIGSLFVNPGGPGGSGVDFVRDSLDTFTPAVRARFDVVGFDPRGVGRSAPVRCRSDAELDRETTLDPTPDTQAERNAYVAQARAQARGCARRSGAILPYLTTEATARDLDLLREAVGDDALTYVGFSYGTVLGATYASLFPQNVRALALDGAADPVVWAAPAARFLRVQAVGFRDAYRAFLAAAREHRGWGLESLGDPATVVQRLLRRLDRTPLVVREEGGRVLNEQQAVNGIAVNLYSSEAWPFLALGVRDAWVKQDGEGLLEFADLLRGRDENGRYDNSEDAYTAISCVDHAPAPRTVAPFTALARELTRITRFLGAELGYEQLPCAFWPVQAASRYTGPFTAAGAPPILVVGTTGDPATPYVWAQSLASQLESGVLLTRRGTSHVAYDESHCVRRAVDRYLLTLQPPRDGTVCST